MTRTEAERRVYRQCGNCMHWSPGVWQEGRPAVRWARCARLATDRECDDACVGFKPALIPTRAVMAGEAWPTQSQAQE